MTVVSLLIGILCALSAAFCFAVFERPLLVLSESDEDAIRAALRSGGWFYVC
jgi:hypothetical protein